MSDEDGKTIRLDWATLEQKHFDALMSQFLVNVSVQMKNSRGLKIALPKMTNRLYLQAGLKKLIDDLAGEEVRIVHSYGEEDV